MTDWPPIDPAKQPHDKEKTYLTLVDMFVDVVEPAVIQMVLQNRNWDLDAALEDIMMLSTNAQGSSNKKNVTMGPIKKSPMVSSKHLPNSINPVQRPQTMMDIPVVSDRKNTKRPMSQMPTERVTSAPTSTSVLPFFEQYGLVKALPDAFDRTVMLIKNGVKLVVLLRGLPGAGKSHLARRLLNEAGISLSEHKRHIFSTDDFFIKNNLYIFVPDQLSEAHSWNQRNVSTAVREQLSPIIVDNTHTQSWEMRPYAEMAVMAGYDIEILEPDTWWFTRDNELAKRNVHGVPRAKIRIMLDRYERNITPKLLMQQFNLRYSLTSAPPQPAIKSKWKDKANSQMNKPRKKKNDSQSNKKNTQSNIGNLNSKFQSFHLNSNDLQASSPSIKNGSNSFSNFALNENPFASELQNKSKMPQSSSSMDSVPFPQDVFSNVDKGLFPTDARFVPTSDSDIQKKYEDIEFFKRDKLECNQNPFNFNSESNKLLAALYRPSSATPFSHSDQPLSQQHPSPSHSNQLPSFQNIAAFNNIFSTTSSLTPNEKSLSIEKDENAEEKFNNISDLMGGIIDRVTSNQEQSYESSLEKYSSETKSDEWSWDYVLVNDDKTFTYKRTSFEPIIPQTDLTSEVQKNAKIDYSAKDDNVNKYAFFNKEIQAQTDIDLISFADVIPDLKTEAQMETQENSAINKEECHSPSDNTIPKVHDMSFKSVFDRQCDQPDNLNENGSILNQSYQDKCFKLLDVKLLEATADTCSDKKSEVVMDSKENCSTETPHQLNNSDVLEMMQDILNSMSQRGENPSLLDKSEFEPKIGSCKEGENEDKQSEQCDIKEDDNNVTGSFQPKPLRSLKKPRYLTTTVQSLHSKQLDKSVNFLNWDVVSNPLEDWSAKDSMSLTSSEKSPILPQRPKSIKNPTTNSFTNTNYQDFQLVKNTETAPGVKILIGNCKDINPYNITMTVNLQETLLLDKGTMTLDSVKGCSSESFDIDHVKTLFPDIPEKYIRYMIEKCQGDVNWAVDLLLDSEYSIYTTDELPFLEQTDENVVDSNTGDTEVKVESTTNQEPINKNVNKEEQAEVKRILENSFVIGKSHYSEKMLKVLKKKHPDYVNMIEHGQFGSEKASSEVEVAGINLQEETRENMVNESEEMEESSSSASFDSEHEDDTFELIFNNDLVLQLQQKFGNSNLPKIQSLTSVVKLPVALARQLYGYLMDSLQTEMDDQQTAIENTIAQDDEVAKLLQFQDELFKPQLQEIMDMEMALEVHRAEQQEWKQQIPETLAAKLSKKILLEKFPNIDPKVLVEVLHSHNYSLHDAEAMLRQAVGDPAQPSSQDKDAEEWEEEEDEEGGDPVSEAQSHRQEAASYYSLRAECMAKAHEAYRSGNKAVASYYSQMAQIHKNKIEQCNSRAAACLLSTHQTGTNTLDLHFLHVSEAAVVLDMFLDETVSRLNEQGRRCVTVFLITGRGARSAGGISRIKPMVQHALQSRSIVYNEVNPGMLSAVVRNSTAISSHSG